MSSRTNALVFLIACGALPALPARELTPAWIELGPSGQVLARVVVNSPDACPVLQADRRPLPMQLRSPVPAGFLPACEALVPPKTHSLTLAGKPLRLPKTPRRVAVLGDTGCRVKGNQIQNCGDPAVWPFRAVAARIAAESPDLIIHVGDYLYRESPCPDPSRGCAGPNGDNWPAWKADFFEPAGAALSAAPWAFSRGNHEDCRRSWRGWFYYLDPRPFSNACAAYSEPYIAQSGGLRLGMLDSASVLEDGAGRSQVERYAAQLRSFSGQVSWIADHHPFWAFKSGVPGGGAVISRPLAGAWESAKPDGVRLILSGHVHLFEFLAFEHGRPAQLVAGDSGTALAKSLAPDFSGATVGGAAVESGKSRQEFGYTVLRRRGKGWTLTLRNSEAKDLVTCKLPEHGPAGCKVR